MPAKSSDDLYVLIQALSPVEKRVFRKFSGRQAKPGGNSYLLLFDAIDRMPVWDEAALRDAFAGKPLLRNLAEAKSYLLESILAAMRSTGRPISKEAEGRQLLDQLEWLYAKGLTKLAEKQLQKGLQLARKFELHGLMADLCRWDRRITKVRGGKQVASQLDRIAIAEMRALEAMVVEAQIRAVLGKLQLMVAAQLDPADAHQQAELEALRAMPVLQAPPLVAGFHALAAYYSVQSLYHRLMGDDLATLQTWEHLVALWEAHPAQQDCQPDQYGNALVALMDVQLKLQQFDVFLEAMAKFQAQPPMEKGAAARKFFLQHHLYQRYAQATGRYGEAADQIPTFFAGLQVHKKYLSPQLEKGFLFNMASICFLAGRYPEAQQYLHLILNLPRNAKRDDILDASLVLELLSHFARGNDDVLEHLLKAHERRIRQYPVPSPLGKLVTSYLRKLERAMDAAARQDLYREMLAAAEGKELDAARPGWVELAVWLRSRIL